MHSICIVLDDLASEPKFHRNYGPISELFTKGRHHFCQLLLSSQKWKLMSPTARVNSHWIVVFKLRNRADLDGFLSELTAIYPYDQKFGARFARTSAETLVISCYKILQEVYDTTG
jgi:hypothetical protein